MRWRMLNQQGEVAQPVLAGEAASAALAPVVVLAWWVHPPTTLGEAKTQWVGWAEQHRVVRAGQQR